MSPYLNRSLLIDTTHRAGLGVTSAPWAMGKKLTERAGGSRLHVGVDRMNASKH